MDGLFLLGVLLAQGVSGPTNSALQIEASLAFDGYVNDRGFSELRVRATGGTGGTLILETTGANPEFRVRVELSPGKPTEIWLPLQIDYSSSALSINASLGQLASREIPLSYERHGLHRSVLLGPRSSHLFSHLQNTQSIHAAALPHIPGAFSQISALAVDSQSMMALDQDQLRSLLDYAGTCGRLLLIGVSNAVGQLFTDRAACDGQFLVLLGNEQNADSTFIELIEKADIALPSGQTIKRLLSDKPANVLGLTRLALFWAGYLTLLILLLTTTRVRFAALGFSAVCTVMALFIWPAPTSRFFVAWAEMTSTERIARYVSIERYAATRRGTFTLPSRNFDGNPGHISGQDYFLDWRANNILANIVWNATPLQQVERITRGSFPVDATVLLELDENFAGVCNNSNRTTEPMYLHWQGDLYEIPPLGAGTHWSSEHQTAMGDTAQQRSELRLFRQRSARHPLAVLQSLTIPDADPAERAWLLRHQSHSNGVSPCAS